MNLDLEARIAAVLNGVGDADEAAALLADLEARAVALKAEHAKADARSLDPRTPATEAQAAAERVAALTFEAKRLERSAAAVAAALAAVRKAANDAAAQAATDAVRAERDAIGAELEATYPELVDRLLKLFRRKAANEYAAADVARAFYGATPGLSAPTDTLRTLVRLPSWNGSSFWPPQAGERSHPFDHLSPDEPPETEPAAAVSTKDATDDVEAIAETVRRPKARAA